MRPSMSTRRRNRRMRAAARHEVPPDTRALQSSWDRVISARTASQLLALAGLLAVTLTQ